MSIVLVFVMEEENSGFSCRKSLSLFLSFVLHLTLCIFVFFSSFNILHPIPSHLIHIPLLIISN